MKIKIYSAPNCPWCQLAKEFLSEHQIPFEDIDVSQNEAALNEMISKTNQMGVPVIDIDGQIIIGFDKNRLMELLNLQE
jgi:glutaredoxin-like YruB-family protein